MKKNAVYFMILFAIAGAITPASFLLGAAEPRAQAAWIAADAQTQQLMLRAREAIQRSPAWVALSLAQQRNRLLDDIESLTILHEKYVIDIKFFDEKIKIQQEYQDFLSKILNKNSSPDLIAQYAIESYNRMFLYLDKANKMADEPGVLWRAIKDKKDLTARKIELYGLRFAQSREEGDILEKREAVPYAPPSSRWDRFWAFFSGKRDLTDTQKEVDALVDKLASIMDDSEKSAQTALAKRQETEDRRIDIEYNLKMLASSDIEMPRELADTLRMINTWFDVVIEQVDKMHQLSLKIYDLRRELERAPTTY
jgi:hypothetical protein